MMDDKFTPIFTDSPLGQMLEKFKGFDFSNVTPVYSTFDSGNMYRQMLENIQNYENIEIDPIIPEGYFEQTQKYQQQSLEMLKSINQNTANLYTLVDLISNSNDKQDEILAIISDIWTIAKATDKKEAESFFKNALQKINDSAESADSIIKLVGWATAIYNTVVTILPQ